MDFTFFFTFSCPTPITLLTIFFICAVIHNPYIEFIIDSRPQIFLFSYLSVLALACTILLSTWTPKVTEYAFPETLALFFWNITKRIIFVTLSQIEIVMYRPW